MNIVEFNSDALDTAIRLVAGDQAADMVAVAYKVINAVEAKAFDEGLQEANINYEDGYADGHDDAFASARHVYPMGTSQPVGGATVYVPDEVHAVDDLPTVERTNAQREGFAANDLRYGMTEAELFRAGYIK